MRCPACAGFDLEFDLNQASGRARLSMRHGSVDVPDFFSGPADPHRLAFGHRQVATIARQMAVQVSDIRFANADAQGQAQIKWQTGDPGIRLRKAVFRASLTCRRP